MEKTLTGSTDSCLLLVNRRLGNAVFVVVVSAAAGVVAA